jgi:hypothetical protein
VNDLLKHATTSEAAIIRGVIRHGSLRKAARALGLARGSVSNAIARARRRAAKVDPTTHINEAPPGYRLKGVSSLRKVIDPETGKEILQWSKTERGRVDPAELLEDFRVALAQGFPKTRPTRAPAVTDADLCAVYPWGDPHFGMLAWGEESGQDYDLAIAEKHHCAAIDALVDRAPAAETAVFINVGDASHADSGAATTTAGTRVDVDSRYPKVQRAIIRTWVYAIKRMLTKHKTVYVFNAIGNHDTNTSSYISLCLEAYFHSEPRVVVDPGVSKYQYLEFGRNLIGITHGDGAKPQDLGGVLLANKREAFARCRWVYWYTGHEHHERTKEYPGYLVFTFRTVAPKDGWHAGKGYGSEQSMTMHVLHRTRGKIETRELGIEEIRELAAC